MHLREHIQQLEEYRLQLIEEIHQLRREKKEEALQRAEDSLGLVEHELDRAREIEYRGR